MSLVGTAIDFEPLPLLGLVACAIAYGAGVRRLSQRGRHWPWQRSLPFAFGLFVVAVALEGPLAAQDDRLFSAHVVQHLLLSMAGPALIWLGAPITLILQASGRSAQRRLLKILHSRIIRVLTHPLVSWSVFVSTLFILYFSDLYALSLRNSVVHEVIHMHFLAAGLLFFAPVVAVDPHPWRIPHGARLLYVGLTLPAHAFLALALLSASEPLAAQFYVQTTSRSLDQVLADQKVGAAIMWISGDLIAIATVAIVLLQWFKSEDRSSIREDRYQHLQKEIEAASQGKSLPPQRESIY